MDYTINNKKLEAEYRELDKTKNAFLHHHHISPKFYQENYNIMYDYMKNQAFNDFESLGEAIDVLKSPRAVHRYPHECKKNLRNELEKQNKLSNSLMGTYEQYLNEVTCRMVNIRLLVDEFAKITPETMNASTSKHLAKRIFGRNVETNIGWTNEILFDIGQDLMDYTEDKRGWGNSVCFTATIGIPGDWNQQIHEKGISVVDIAGKNYLTLEATEVEEHELKDQDIQLYTAKLLTTKVPKGSGTWRLNPGEGKNFILFEERVLAVQNLPSGEKRITTGKDVSWAIRTMKQRLKKEMFAMMDI